MATKTPSIIDQVVTPLTSKKNIKKLREGFNDEEYESPTFTPVASVTKSISDAANNLMNTFSSKPNDDDIEKNKSAENINIGSSLKPKTPSVKKTETPEKSEKQSSIFPSFNIGETLSLTPPDTKSATPPKTSQPTETPMTFDSPATPFSPLSSISNMTSQVGESIGNSAKSASNMATAATAATMSSAANLAVDATASMQQKSHVRTFVMFLLGISLCILGYNLYLFMTEKQDIFKKFLNFDFIQPRKVINNEDKEKVSKLFSSEPEIPKSQVEKKTKAPVVVNDERKKGKTSNGYEPDSHMDSSIQASAKKGWCYIGTDRGYRSCVELEANKCLSGDIFPSKDICINPSLRFE